MDNMESLNGSQRVLRLAPFKEDIQGNATHNKDKTPNQPAELQSLFPILMKNKMYNSKGGCGPVLFF